MNQLPNGSKQAVIYVRVSSKEQEEEGYSVPAQTKLLMDYAAKKAFDVIGEYVDVETAKRPGRPGFNEMVKFFASQAKRDRNTRPVLLVEKTDRLYRNLRDYVTIDELGLDIHFVKEGSIISPTSHSSEKFTNGIKVLMAKQYIDNLSEETRKGLQEKAEQGIWPLRPPIGYRTYAGPSGKRLIEPDPDPAPLISKLFEWYGTGNNPLRQLVKMALEAGLVMPRSKRPLNRGEIHKVLTNPIYYGEFLWKGKLYPGIHKPLVGRQLWDKVQGLLKQRGIRKPRQVKHNYAFSGLITCGHCGCALVAELKKKQYIYYRCTHFKKRCPDPYVREEVLEQQFVQILRSLTFDPEFLAWAVEALKESHRDEQQFHSDAVDRCQSEYKRLQGRIEQMYIDKLDGRVDADFFDTKASEWRAAQRQYLQDIEKHQRANQKYMHHGVALLELASRAAELFERRDARQKRLLLNFVLSNSVWADGVLTPVFRQPFDMIADAAKLCATKKAAGASSGDLRLEMGG